MTVPSGGLTGLTELEGDAPMVVILADDIRTATVNYLRAAVPWCAGMVLRERRAWDDATWASEPAAQYVSHTYHLACYRLLWGAVANGCWRANRADLPRTLHALREIERAIEASVRGIVPTVIEMAMIPSDVDAINTALNPKIAARAAWVRDEVIRALTTAE